MTQMALSWKKSISLQNLQVSTVRDTDTDCQCECYCPQIQGQACGAGGGAVGWSGVGWGLDTTATQSVPALVWPFCYVISVIREGPGCSRAIPQPAAICREEEGEGQPRALPTLSPHQEAFSAPLGLWPLPAVCTHATTPKSKRDTGRCAGGPGLATKEGGGARAAGMATQHSHCSPGYLSFLPHPLLSWTSVLTLVCPVLETGANVLQTEEDPHFWAELGHRRQVVPCDRVPLTHVSL